MTLILLATIASAVVDANHANRANRAITASGASRSMLARGATIAQDAATWQTYQKRKTSTIKQ